jgi:hypothetical protein
MPAVQLTRLKMQSALLADSFSRPDAFVKGLRAMLEFYANRSHRPGQSGAPHPLLASYNVPPPVLKQIALELGSYITANPEGAIRLSDRLWQEENLECRLLAAQVLGRVPVSYSQPLLQQIQVFLAQEEEDQLIDALLKQSLTNTRRGATNDYLAAVHTWLMSADLRAQEMGLRALLPLIEDPDFDNLPVVYRMLTPYTRTTPPRLKPFLLQVLSLLVKRSPQESAFFLRHSLEMPDSEDAAWLIRQLLILFPADIQSGLREAVKKKIWQM